MIGQTISHYRIAEKLGEGGMGVVYKAMDTKLDRAVALKFLPSQVVASEQDKARFIQEAKSASALNHPNVATVYEIDECDGQMFIAMEFIDGVTLREKISTLSMKQVIEIGIQLADGLAAAHEKGITHRDIKPENIMVRRDGICQIMDFGLAKLRGTKSKVSRLTKEGSTIGTAGYMSPEQVQGQDVDHRSDIFSLGVVLYELFTGELPFKGVHETALLYEIVNVDAVPMSAVKAEIDPSLDAIVLECLAKEPGERYQSVAEVAKELRRFKRESTRQRVSRVTSLRAAYPSSTGQHPVDLPRPTTTMKPGKSFLKTPLVPFILAGIFLIVASVLAYLYRMEISRPEPLVMFNLLPPEKGRFDSPVPAISPNGQYIALLAHDSTGKGYIWLRSIGSTIAKPLEGTQDAAFPFWSPDSRFLAFFTPGKMKKIEIGTGSIQTICDASDARGGSWSTDGQIIFAPDWNTGLSVVSAAGGAVTPVTTLDTTRRDQTHRLPCFLPDGQHFIYFIRSGQDEKTGVYYASLDGKQNTMIFTSPTNALFAPPDQLLFIRERTLVAQRFEPRGGTLLGDAAPLTDDVGSLSNYAVAAFSVSQNGTIAMTEGVSAGDRQLVWYDRTGKELKRTVARGSIFDFRLSPDQQRVAFRRIDPQTQNQDIWILDLLRNTQSRFTFDQAVDDDPVWSPDGSKLAYDSNPEGALNIYLKASTGAENPEVLVRSKQAKNPEDWSSDGKYILYQNDGTTTKGDVWALPLFGDKKPFPFLNSNFTETDARFSPDGQWVAYASDESGKFEVYIQRFPVSGGKWQVSTNGGGAPSWRKDGKELYYLAPDRKLMAVGVNTHGSMIEIGVPSPLFETNVDLFVAPNRYDVAPDGKSFLVNNSTVELSTKPMTVMVHWTSKTGKQ